MQQFNQTISEFDNRSLRSRLGRFATGITVVTVKDAGGHYIGRTINSFASVSLDPPLILWSLNRFSTSLRAFASMEHFAVHVLGADQVSTAERFAKMGTRDPFHDHDVSEGLGGVPIIHGCAVVFECRKYDLHSAGDHIVFFGEILRIRETEKPGLVFHNGSYALSRPHPALRGKRPESFYFSPF